MSSPVLFTDKDSDVLIPTASNFICKSIYCDELSKDASTKIEYLLPNFVDSAKFKVSTACMSPKKTCLLVAKEFADLPPKICIYKSPKSEVVEVNMVPYVCKKPFESPEMKALRFSHISFCNGEDQFMCLLQGEKDMWICYVKVARECEYTSNKLANYPVHSLTVNPFDPMTVAISTEMGISVYRMENNKFKTLQSKLLPFETGLVYQDLVFVNVNKSTVVLCVLDNRNTVHIINADKWTFLQKHDLGDEYTSTVIADVFEEKIETLTSYDDLNVVSVSNQSVTSNSNLNTKMEFSKIKLYKKGFLAWTKQGILLYFKINVSDILEKSYKVFILKTAICYKNKSLLNKGCQYIDVSAKDSHCLITLEDGTSFMQNILGIEIETCKIHVKPLVIEHLNIASRTMSISKHKPVITTCDKTVNKAANNIVMRDYLTSSLVSMSQNFSIRDFVIHNSGLYGYAIVDNKLYQIHVINENIKLTKEIRLYNEDSTEILKGLEFDENYGFVVMWSQHSIYVVNNNEVEMKLKVTLHKRNIIWLPRVTKIKRCGFEPTGRIVGFLNNNTLFQWDWQRDEFHHDLVWPEALLKEGYKRESLQVKINDFVTMDNGHYLVFCQYSTPKVKKPVRYVTEARFKHDSNLELKDRILDSDQHSISPDACCVRDSLFVYDRTYSLYYTGTTDGAIRIYEKIPEPGGNMFDKSIYSEFPLHQGRIKKLVLVKDKENRFLFSLGKDKTIVAMAIKDKGKGVTYLRSLYEYNPLSSVNLMDVEQYRREWGNVKDYISKIHSDQYNALENLKRDYDIQLREKDDQSLQEFTQLNGIISEQKKKMEEMRELNENYYKQNIINQEQNAKNINDLEQLYDYKLFKERKKYVELGQLYNDLENKLNIELLNQKQNYENERGEILKEFYKEFKKYEVELKNKDEYANKIKTEFKEKERQIENEHSEEVLWLNKETKRILSDTYKDLKSYKEIANKDKKALEKSEGDKNRFNSEKSHVESSLKSRELEIERYQFEQKSLLDQLNEKKDEIKVLKDDINAKNQKIKELQKTKKILSEKAAELKHSYIEPYELKISTLEKDKSGYEKVIYENNRVVNDLKMKIIKLECYKKTMKDWQHENLGKNTKYEKVLSQIQNEIVVFKNGKDERLNNLKYKNEATFIDHLYKKYVMHSDSEIIGDIVGDNELKKVDEFNKNTIENLNRDLRNEREKNLRQAKMNQQEKERRYEENKSLINQISELRKEIKNLKFKDLVSKQNKGLQADMDIGPDLEMEDSEYQDLRNDNSDLNLKDYRTQERDSLPVLNDKPQLKRNASLKPGQNKKGLQDKTYSTNNNNNNNYTSNFKSTHKNMHQKDNYMGNLTNYNTLNNVKSRVVKGKTNLSHSGSQQVINEYKWDELNSALDNHRDKIYRQKSEIELLKDKLDEKEYIIQSLTTQVKTDSGYLYSQADEMYQSQQIE